MLSHQVAINEVVHEIVARYGGTISAEHGLGQLGIARRRATRRRSNWRCCGPSERVGPAKHHEPGKLLP